MLTILGISDFLVQNQWIKWVPTLIIVLIMVLALLFGLWRGFRKSMHKFVIMLICFLIGFAVFMLITSNNGQLVYSVAKGPIDSALGVTSDDGTLLGALRVFITAKVAAQQGGYEQIAIEVYPQIEVLAVMALRLVAFLVAFVLYIVFLLLINFFYTIFHSEKRYKKKLAKLERPYRKRRLLGGGIGIVRGLIASTICASFFGLIFYSVSASNNLEKADFTDPQMQEIYDIDYFVKELGDTGIYKLLNNMRKDENSAPYYLFFADAILSAKTKGYDGNEYNVKLSHELASISGLAQDMMHLLSKHATDIELSKLQGDELIDYLDKLFTKEEFVNDLNNVIDKYQGTEYIKNLAKITVGAVTKNIDTLLGGTEDPNKQQILDFYHKMFDKNAAGDDYIAPEDIVTFDDTKLLIKGVVNSAPKILDLVSFYDDSKNNPVYQNDAMALNINVANKGLDTFTSFYNSISGMSFMNKEGNKRTKMDGVLNRGIAYFFDLVVGESEVTNPFVGNTIAWFDELDGFQNAFGEINNLTSEFISEFNRKYQESHEFTMQKAMINVLSDTYEGKTKIDKAFDSLTNYVSQYKSVQVLLDSEFFYSVAEKQLETMLSVEDVKIPQNINWIDSETEEGELRIFLNSARAAISNGVLDFVMSEPDFTDLNNVKKLVSILDSKYRDTTLLSYLFNSNLLYYGSSIALLNFKNENFEILIPEEISCDQIDGIKCVKRDEILALVKTIPTVLNEITDFETIQNDPLAIIDILKLDNVREALVGSNILTATAAKTINTMALDNPDVKDMLVIPERLALNGPKDQERVENWLNVDGKSGELDKLLGVLAVEELDIKKLTEQDPQAIIKLTKITEEKFNKLISSDIIHYSFTKILNKLSTADFSIKIPGDVYDEAYTDALVITSGELYNMLKAASTILKVDEVTNELGYDLNAAIDNRNVILDSLIIHATVVNLLLDKTTNDPELAKTLVIPADLKTVDFENFKASVWYNADSDKTEVSKILGSVKLLEIDLNNLEGLDTNKLVNKVLTLDEKVSTEASAPTKIEKICDSRILSRSLTNVAATTKDDAGNLIITVPGEAYDDALSNEVDQYIKASEWLNLISGIKTGFGLTAEDNLMEKLEDPMALVDGLITAELTEYQARRDKLLESNILHATVVSVFLDQTANESFKDSIKVPANYQKSEIDFTKFTDSNWYKNHEIANILDALPILGIKLSDSTTVDPDNLTKKVLGLDAKYNPTDKVNPNKTKVEKLCDSMIISRTLTHTVVNLKDSANKEMIVVPTEAYDSKLSFGTDEFISSSEWLSLIKGIKTGFGLDENTNITEAFNDPMALVDNLITAPLAEYQVRRDELLKSYMLHATVVSKFLETANTPEMSGTIKIPTAYNVEVLSHQKFNDNIWAAKDSTTGESEIANILDALPILGIKLSDSTTVDPDNLTKKVLGLDNKYNALDTVNPNKTKIEKLCESRIISRTLTYTVANLKDSTDKNLVIVPLEAYEEASVATEDKYISSGEWLSLIKGIKTGFGLDETTNITEAFNDPMALVDNLITAPLPEYQARRDELLKSYMLHSTIVKTFLDTAKEPGMAGNIIIPTEYEVNITSDTKFADNIWKTKNEIANILDILPILDIKLSDSATLNPDELINKLLILDEIYNPLDPVNPEKTNIEKLCESKVLARTLTNAVSTNESINVPAKAYENDDPLATDPYIKSSEWFNMIHGIKVAFNLNVGDNLSSKIADFEGLIANLFDADYTENRNALMASYILENTMIETVITTLSTVDMVVVPNILSVNHNEKWYAKRNADASIAKDGEGEAMHLLDTFNALEIGSSIGKPNFDEIVTTKLSIYGLLVVKSDTASDITKKQEKQAALMASDVLTASFINVIYDLNGTLTIPNSLDYGKGKDAKQELVNNYNDNFSWLKKSGTENSELENIFKSINALRLDVTAANPNSISFDMNSILNDEELVIANVLSSKIIHLTVSEELVKIKALMFVEGNTVETINGEHYVNKNEFDYLLNGMQTLFRGNDGKINLNEFKVSNLFGAKYEENMDTLFSSNILEATLFKNVYEGLGTFATMTKETEFSFAPNANILSATANNLNNWLKLDSEGTGPTKELRKMFDVINILDLGNAIDTGTVDVTLEKITPANINKILDSTVFAASMTKVLVKDTAGALNIPAALNSEFDKVSAKTTNYNDTNLRVEVENVFKALDNLNITTTGNTPDVNVNSLLDNLNTAEKVSANLGISSIMYLTVSKKIYGATNTVLDYTTDVFATLTGYTESVINNTEIAGLVAGIQAMGANMDTINIKPSTILANIDNILKSKVLHITISNAILEVEIAKNSLYRKDRISTEAVDLLATTANDQLHYLEKLEISSFLNALTAIGVSENFNFDIDFTNLLSTNADKLYTMIKSDIARNIISNVLVVGGDIPNPIPYGPATIKIDYSLVVGKTVKINSIFTTPEVLNEFKAETGLSADYVLEALTPGDLYDSNHVKSNKLLMGAKEIMGMAYLISNPSSLI